MLAGCQIGNLCTVAPWVELKGETVHFFNFPGFWFLQGQYSHLALLAAFDCIDDTKLVKQIIISVSNSHSLEFKLK